MKTRRALGFGLSATLILVTLALSAWHWGALAKLRALSPEKVALAAPLASPSATAVRADGRVAAYPNASVVIGTETGGTLAIFRVGEQDAVKRGDVIAELDATEQKAALVEARARVQEADVSIRFLGTQLEKSRHLVEVGAVPRDELDRMKHQHDMAVAQRAVAAATVSRLLATLAKATIRAPFDGVILERHAEERETLAPGAQLVTIADLSRLRIEAEVDEFDASRVARGDVVTITAEGNPGSWKGTVEEVPSAITRRRTKPDDPTRPTDTRVLLVKIAVDVASNRAPLRLGQRVEVAIGR